jgi:hypothetical protein
MSIDYKLKKHGVYSLKYADDGIFYSNNSVDPLELLNKNKRITGVDFNREKSGWIKKDDV